MSQQLSDFIEMKVPAKPEYVGVVRLTVSGVANRVGYTYDDIEDIKIAVAEACTNVVNHAYDGEESEAFMTVGCGVYSDRIEMMVADRGNSFDIEALKKDLGPIDAQEPIGDMKEGGLGLFLIDTLMDRVEICGESGVIIMMTKFLQRGEVEQSDDGISAKTKQ
ncbi:anti-sigma B factor RsbW [Texcoconibacillus texcoconensis]|uniref:Serine-protein kinase RsbW n=1 Tax=Texcoconibacillus texcoconensis TaxID=1095777 RepID=A0A840QSF4_9BACI|nr:anti-sigma B factor RsbW [Texcoconibacillus texcoconensis]MBB5174207.1 serine/threonine-protein kinase RsbW [Texcoconibacillus texcoconensis]